MNWWEKKHCKGCACDTTVDLWTLSVEVPAMRYGQPDACSVQMYVAGPGRLDRWDRDRWESSATRMLLDELVARSAKPTGAIRLNWKPAAVTTEVMP